MTRLLKKKIGKLAPFCSVSSRFSSTLFFSFFPLGFFFYISRALANNLLRRPCSLPLEYSASLGPSEDALPSDRVSPNLEHPNQECVDCTLMLKVQDTGIGMSDEEQARLFKRFSQANNRTAHVSKIITKEEQEKRRQKQTEKQLLINM